MLLLGEEAQHFIPDVIGDPERMKRSSVCIELCLHQLFEKELALPNRVTVIFNVIDQESRQWKFSKPLYISAYWSIHHQKLSDSGGFINSIKYRCSSLRMSEHGIVALIVQGCQDLSEQLQWKCSDRFLSAFRLPIARTVNCNNVKLFQVWHSDQILMKKVGILFWWVFRTWAMDD